MDRVGAATKPPTDIFPDDQLLSVQVAIRAGKPTFYVVLGAAVADDARSPHRLWKFEGTDPAGKWQRVDTNIPGSGTVINGVDVGRIGIFAVAPTDPGRLYASHLGPNGPEMVFSNDGGGTWFNDPVLDARMTGGGIFKYQTGLGGGPTNFTPNFFGYPQPSLIAFAPQDPNIVVSGGRDSGVFLSMNGGVTWDLLTDPFDSGTSGIPHLPRPWFAYFGEASVGKMNIYIGTQGRGVWRITVTVPRVTLNEDQVAFTVDQSSQQTITRPLKSLSSVVGDADDFHAGDEADMLSPFLGNQSRHVEGLLEFFEVPTNGFQGTVDLDTPANNQAVGFTHFLSPLASSQITNATVTFTMKGTGNVANDTILYNDSGCNMPPPPGAFPGCVPFITLQDVLRQNVIGSPSPDQTLLPDKIYTLRIDLSNVPVRFANTSPPGGNFSGDPDAFLDLRPLVTSQGHFDMVFSDDTSVDGSILSASVDPPIEVGGCPAGSAGRFSFTATLTNLMPNTLDDIRISVDQSTSSGVRLLLPTGELISSPGDVLLSDLTPAHIDSLPPNAWVKVPFDLCLSSVARFNFFVNVNALAGRSN